MATVTDTNLSGRALRVLRSIDASGNTSWYKLSLWSLAQDTVFSDGRTAQTKLGAINGITSDVTATATDVAASIKVVRDVNLKVDTNTRNLGNCKLSYEGGKYYIQVGADAGTKKPLGSGLESAKKIIYREIENDDTTTYPILSKTISANGNTITYICNRKASKDDGADYSNEYSLVYETVHGPVQDWAGGEVVGYLVGCRFYLKNLFPNDYKNWTQDNFFFFLTDWNVRCSHGNKNNVSIVEEKQQCNMLDRTYDTTTGELMFNRIISYIYESDRGGTGGYVGYTIREWQMWIIG